MPQIVFLYFAAKMLTIKQTVASINVNAKCIECDDEANDGVDEEKYLINVACVINFFKIKFHIYKKERQRNSPPIGFAFDYLLMSKGIGGCVVR